MNQFLYTVISEIFVEVSDLLIERGLSTYNNIKNPIAITSIKYELTWGVVPLGPGTENKKQIII